MINSEYNIFRNMWHGAVSLYRSTPPEENSISLAFSLLKEFPLQEVSYALAKACETAEFAPTPASIKKIIQQNRGAVVSSNEEEVQLQIKAKRFLNSIDEQLSCFNDCICADAQGCLAFKEAFKSLSNYCNSDPNSYAYSRDFQFYLKVYGHLPLTGDIESDHLIKGTNHKGENLKTTVRFIGDFYICNNLSRQIYGERQITKSLSYNDPIEQKRRMFMLEDLEKKKQEHYAQNNLNDGLVPKEQVFQMLEKLAEMLRPTY